MTGCINIKHPHPKVHLKISHLYCNYKETKELSKPQQILSNGFLGKY